MAILLPEVTSSASERSFHGSCSFMPPFWKQNFFRPPNHSFESRILISHMRRVLLYFDWHIQSLPPNPLAIDTLRSFHYRAFMLPSVSKCYIGHFPYAPVQRFSYFSLSSAPPSPIVDNQSTVRPQVSNWPGAEARYCLFVLPSLQSGVNLTLC